jgi:hypothetical protein
MSYTFTPDDVPSIRLLLSARYPYASVTVDTPGNVPSLTIRLSLDPRNEWRNGIFHNSRFLLAAVWADGTLESCAGIKVRKTRHAIVAGSYDRLLKAIAKATEGK